MAIWIGRQVSTSNSTLRGIKKVLYRTFVYSIASAIATIYLFMFFKKNI